MRKIKADVKAKWLKALRSGEYKQIKSELHNSFCGEYCNEEGYCCLGVLTDIYLKEHKLNWGDKDASEIYIKQSDGYLHSPVSEWAGIDSDNPMVVVKTGCGEMHRSLTDLNDSGSTFNEIADLIEPQL